MTYEPNPEVGCQCGELHLNAGNHTSVMRNWNPDCPEHGLDSEWYNSVDQRQARVITNQRLRDVQARATEKRRRLRRRGWG